MKAPSEYKYYDQLIVPLYSSNLLKKFPLGSIKDIMIICLYKEQKFRLDKILNGRQRRKKYNVLTGKEAPIVIVMTTRTEKASDFFCCMNRCNVAVSRQQKALIILGKASLLTNYPCNVAVSRQQKALIVLGKAPLLTTNKPWSTVVNGDDFTTVKARDIN
ncbi:hypothetical protein PRIPAC_81850 [Pristionchus pacificus]|uniref:AAA_12 domain-containing protein n=1 Tax=Pristionchus pacificus TaxID=54126 RepID=A0A2A6BEG7_PRIPA|nr:hypothetical protein PRIPAC_78516 [Pristionchus pacificus]KAF8372253.1 hypothetical protein PRIPAC_78682 [Pristionchus pacificus]KAF8374948.1 hypothetical protein PRIPAC_81377 [Pristionchus pacificus]KAF8375421.1 hypothetical protein PRIPAC_81850 [Pristionchus pacificus]|eukprot:PDM64272.1 hypothetical protein PRIPAC_53647 [Pristionchus pacificus]